MTKEEAIKYLKWARSKNPYSLDKKNLQESVDMAIKALEQQKTGQWIWIESIGVWKFMCSVCKESVNPMPTCMGKPLMKYCPNCGVKMEVEE